MELSRPNGITVWEMTPTQLINVRTIVSASVRTNVRPIVFDRRRVPALVGDLN